MFTTHPIAGEIYVGGFIAAFFISLAINAILVGVFKYSENVQRRVVDLPHMHKKKVMTFGGAGVVLSFLGTLWIGYFYKAVPAENLHLFRLLTLVVGVIFILGIFDDVADFTARIKFMVQIVIMMALYFSGLRIDHIGDWLLNDSISFFLTALWIIGVTNAVNLIDGHDGLAGGVIFFSCFTLAFVYLGRSIYEASWLSIVLAGSLMGFLAFNFPPAKIILGDTGSLPVGLTVAIIPLLPVNQGFANRIYYLMPVIALLYPIMDTASSFFRRVLKGKNPFQKDQEHYHHRLIRLGLSPLQTVSILYATSFYFGLISLVPIFYINLLPHFLYYFFMFILLSIFAILYLLSYFEKADKNFKE